jgi:hypothetical protein
MVVLVVLILLAVVFGLGAVIKGLLWLALIAVAPGALVVAASALRRRRMREQAEQEVPL